VPCDVEGHSPEASDVMGQDRLGQELHGGVGHVRRECLWGAEERSNDGGEDEQKGSQASAHCREQLHGRQAVSRRMLGEELLQQLDHDTPCKVSKRRGESSSEKGSAGPGGPRPLRQSVFSTRPDNNVLPSIEYFVNATIVSLTMILCPTTVVWDRSDVFGQAAQEVVVWLLADLVHA